MIRPARFVSLVGLALAAACSYVDEPGSTGPTRTTAAVETTLAPPTPAGVLTCPSLPGDSGDAVPASLAAALDDALAHPGWGSSDRSISIWVEGFGEVTAAGADTRLLPASNQKLFTAFGAFLLLDAEQRFTTEVTHTAGRLTLVAGGDPTLRRTGPHSLAALARQVAAAGISTIEELAVDASHFEYDRTALGWQDWHIPTYVGPMSAFTVDDNRYRRDEQFLFDPAIGNLESFRRALLDAGIDAGTAMLESGTVANGQIVASLSSPVVGELVGEMLTRSDNEIAEAILREIGDGSTGVGIERIDEVLEGFCTGRTGRSGDGSGLSRENLRSAREWRSLLQSVDSEPWAEDLRDALPVAGRSGTLARRLREPGVVDNVTAKTGSIIGGRALSGYATRADGRTVVFSIVVNGDAAAAAVAAIDALVVAAVNG